MNGQCVRGLIVWAKERDVLNPDTAIRIILCGFWFEVWIPLGLIWGCCCDDLFGHDIGLVSHRRLADLSCARQFLAEFG